VTYRRGRSSGGQPPRDFGHIWELAAKLDEKPPSAGLKLCSSVSNTCPMRPECRQIHMRCHGGGPDGCGLSVMVNLEPCVRPTDLRKRTGGSRSQSGVGRGRSAALAGAVFAVLRHHTGCAEALRPVSSGVPSTLNPIGLVSCISAAKCGPEAGPLS